MTNPIPEGCDRVIPHLVVKGAAEALEFYAKAFGAEELCRMPAPDGRVMHAEFKIGNSIFYICDDFPEFCGGKPRNPQALGNSPCNLHMYVKDTDAAVKKAVDAGATVTMPPQDMFWGDRYAVTQDPFGHIWSFATHTKDMTPEEIAEAGAAAFA
ncbi:MAG: VOC family protein [Phycisphaerales bacterium]